jgi:GrpB-like predicted nucleotidyltransferase (UPF0157 family)
MSSVAAQGVPHAGPATHGSLPAGPATGDAVRLADHHPSWPARFRVEAEVLRVALAPLVPRFEHIGSTAVPGLTAQPIIDILLGVRVPMAVEQHAARLANFGYQLLPSAYDPGGRRRFLVRAVRGVRTHQAHVVEHLGEDWHRLLLFRDLLCRDPELAGRYAQLKRQLAQQYRNNRLAYTSAKSEFVQQVLGAPVC